MGTLDADSRRLDAVRSAESRRGSTLHLTVRPGSLTDKPAVEESPALNPGEFDR
jgi:hypothetical protein